MPETKQVTFSHSDVAAALVKAGGIHEGIWGLYVEFGIKAANIGFNPEEAEDLLPSAIVPIVKLGIQQFNTENQLTVDASKVNPLSPKRRGTRTKTAVAAKKVAPKKKAAPKKRAAAKKVAPKKRAAAKK